MKFKYINKNFNYKTKLKLLKKSPVNKILILSLIASLSLTGCDNQNITNNSVSKKIIVEAAELPSTNIENEVDNNDGIEKELEKEKIKFELVEVITNNETIYDYTITKDEVANVNEEQLIVQEPTQKIEKKLVAITFDDGPSKYTSELVDILTNNGAKATFFIMGCNIKDYSDSVVKAYQAGNEIGVHTYSHTSFINMTFDEIKNELDQTRSLLDGIDVDYSNIVRPPYGAINDEVENNINTSFILWNVDTRDWESKDAKSIIAEVKGNISEGSIILFHDVYPTTVEAIKKVLPELTTEYEFVTVSELFLQNNKVLEENNKYYKVKK